MAEEKPQTKGIVRILATDIKGQLKLRNALRRIKGIGHVFSRSICMMTELNADKKIGDMSDQEIALLESCIKKYSLPSWMLNRRKDYENGQDIHLIGTSLELKKRDDINRMRRIKAYRGLRHEFGLPVRGQRTRSSFRTQKTVGVMKKKVMPATAKPKQETPKK